MKIFYSIISAILICGCDNNAPKNEGSNKRLICNFYDSYDKKSIYVVTVDGLDYIIIVGQDSVAICPKQQSK